MTAEAAAGLAADFSQLPGYRLTVAQLADLELLLTGAFTPLTGYLGEADTASVIQRGTLADGTAWPVPIVLDVPASVAPPGISRLLLNDPEGVPIAVLDVTESVLVPGQPAGGLLRLSGPLTKCRELEYGPFRHLRRPPAQVRAELGAGPVLAYATRQPLYGRQIGQLRHMAGQLKATVLLLPLTGDAAEVVVGTEPLVRAVRAAARHLSPATMVVPVPLARHDVRPEREIALRAHVAAAYGATHLLTDGPAPQTATPGGQAGPIPMVSAGEWAYDRLAEVWRPLSLIDPGTDLADLTTGELEDLLDRGGEVPAWFSPPGVAAELRRARPPRRERGLVVFFTGLSGSGKSTIARGLRDTLSERGDRTVSLLDGDLVRELLSAGLTFSRADRDLNIARIGFVAAEVARHGGIAICAPIAPYAGARARVRSLVNEVGDFLLIHVATPAEVCEARDRKGLYAKARAGLITNFTGVSDPYEEPRDADLVIDTSTMSKDDAVASVVAMLSSGGWLAEPGTLP